MSKKSDIYDKPVQMDDPVQEQVAEPAQEGGDLIGPAIPPQADAKAQPKHEGTVNELMGGWWKQVRDGTPDPATFGDNFTAYAATRGWALVDADTLPPQDPPPAE